MSAIRILQSLSTLDYSGAEAMIMNMYRNIDRDKIQFDFVVNDRTEPFVFEKEVEKLGGRIFTLPKFSGTNFVLYRKKVNQLLQNLDAMNSFPATTPPHQPHKFTPVTLATRKTVNASEVGHLQRGTAPEWGAQRGVQSASPGSHSLCTGAES